MSPISWTNGVFNPKLEPLALILMAVTITLYNHTRQRYHAGLNAIDDEYRINLYSALPVNATATTKAAAESGATQIPTANGYTQNAKIITGLAATIIGTNHSMIDAPDTEWTATGGNIEAAFAMMYNNTDTDAPPVLRIDFDGIITALDGDPFRIIWPAGGIITSLP